MNLSDITDSAGDVFSDPTFQRIALPALVGAAGTGAVSSFLASRNRDPRETPEARRKRIMLNALMGVGLGGAAGAALPAGIEMLRRPLEAGNGIPLFEKGIDATVDTALGNAAAVGTGVLGSAYVAKNVLGNRNDAINRVVSMIQQPGENSGKALERVRSMLLTPEGREQVLVAMTRKGNRGSIFQANELLQEAGTPGFKLEDLHRLHNTNSGRNKLNLKYQQHLADQGIVSRMFSKLVTQPNQKVLQPSGRVAELLAKVPGLRSFDGVPVNPSRIAETYGRFIRPSVGRITGRVSPLAQLGLLAGGVGLADYAQDKVLGQ